MSSHKFGITGDFSDPITPCNDKCVIVDPASSLLNSMPQKTCCVYDYNLNFRCVSLCYGFDHMDTHASEWQPNVITFYGNVRARRLL